MELHRARPARGDSSERREFSTDRYVVCQEVGNRGEGESVVPH